MQRHGGRNFVAAARVAFALMAPAVAGCAPSPRVPVSETCVSPHATAQEARAVVEAALERIHELHGTLLERLRKVDEEIERLGAAIAYSRQPLRYFLDTGIPEAEGILRRFKESSDALHNGIAEAGEDAESMRILARRACAAQEIAEIQFRSAMDILDMVSAEIRATIKEID